MANQYRLCVDEMAFIAVVDGPLSQFADDALCGLHVSQSAVNRSEENTRHWFVNFEITLCADRQGFDEGVASGFQMIPLQQNLAFNEIGRRRLWHRELDGKLAGFLRDHPRVSEPTLQEECSCLV